MADPGILEALDRATGALPGREDRPPQRMMARAVAGALKERRHLVVQAGTGTGKSLAYLVPILTSGARAVVSTATKALQDQLASRDLPKLAESLDIRFEFCVLKGRSNYLCLQRAAEVVGGDQRMALDTGGSTEQGPSPGSLGREVLRLVEWSRSAGTGDRAELDWEPTDAAWAQVSVGARDCPGAARCPSGAGCFAESARERARLADVVVVNTHLYVAGLTVDGELLPQHDVVVFDEVHELEDIASAGFGFEIGGSKLAALARSTRPLLSDGGPAVAVEEAVPIFHDALSGYFGRALPNPLDDATQDRLNLVRARVDALLVALRRSIRAAQESDGDVSRHLRSQQAATHLLSDLDQALGLSESFVAWVEGREDSPVLRIAPIDVGSALREALWSKESTPTAVLASATIPPRLGERLGLPAGSYDQVDVGSPFAYPEQALLYCPVHLPDPRSSSFEAAMHEELAALMDAAGGRTLALFTSWRAMRSAAEALRRRSPLPILTQSDLPKPALVARFASEEHASLFATMGFWQGLDVPGSSLSVVAIDRLPFPRPDDPLLQARRARLGPAAFELVDVPRAATLLAQGAGRLIRTSSDRGVVAVFDVRLAKASYRWGLVNALPPMRRTRHRSDVEQFLAPLRAPHPSTCS